MVGLVETMLKSGLSFASPFYWSPRVLEIIEVAARDMPAWTLTPEALPFPHGFFWFDKPLPLSPKIAENTPLMAISWTSMTKVRDTEEGNEVVHVTSPGDSANRVAVYFWGKGEGALSPVPYTHAILNMGMTLNEAEEAYKASAMLQEDFHPGSWAAYKEKVRYFACCLSFMEQKIIGTRGVKSRAPRPVRRRMPELEDIEHTVTVVTLRGYESRPKEGESQPVEWKVRWLVRGHWRQQYYATEDIHKPKWISPYLKGPVGKPLKGITKVFQVVR